MAGVSASKPLERGGERHLAESGCWCPYDSPSVAQWTSCGSSRSSANAARSQATRFSLRSSSFSKAIAREIGAL